MISGSAWRGVGAMQQLCRDLRLAAADRVDDLDAVAVAERVRGVPAAWHDLAVDLHGHPPLALAFGLQHRGDGLRRVERTLAPVDHQVHRGMVSRCGRRGPGLESWPARV